MTSILPLYRYDSTNHQTYLELPKEPITSILPLQRLKNHQTKSLEAWSYRGLVGKRHQTSTALGTKNPGPQTSIEGVVRARTPAFRCRVRPFAMEGPFGFLGWALLRLKCSVHHEDLSWWALTTLDLMREADGSGRGPTLLDPTLLVDVARSGIE